MDKFIYKFENKYKGVKTEINEIILIYGLL